MHYNRLLGFCLTVALGVLAQACGDEGMDSNMDPVESAGTQWFSNSPEPTLGLTDRRFGAGLELTAPDGEFIDGLPHRDLIEPRRFEHQRLGVEDRQYAPETYPAGQIHSPMTPYVVDTLRAYAQQDATLNDNVFMKVGASSTVSRSTLACFSTGPVELGEHQALEGTMDYFLGGDAAGTDPFDRRTIAARVGHSAGWVIDGEPSPMLEEWARLRPRFAFVHYGTNDMGLGSTFTSALVAFHENMMELIEKLVVRGTIPVLFGISPRLDSQRYDQWVGTYNAAIRGMAEAWQIPFVDLHEAQLHLDGYGMAGDGVHLNRYARGSCILTSEGLGHGYNVRNLIALEALERLKTTLVDGNEALDAPADIETGRGTNHDPFEIHTLPFSDTRDVRDAIQDEFDSYPECDDANESGPEYVYGFQTDDFIAIRALVLDRGGVDVDLHLMQMTSDGLVCLGRNHHLLDATLEPGTYYFVVDTWVDASAVEHGGPYQFVVLACSPNDEACE